MKRHLLMLAAAFCMTANVALAGPHIHQMPRAPTGKVRPTPIVGSGEYPIPDNFKYDDGLDAVAAHTDGESGVLGDSTGNFRLFCTPAMRANVDPVVYPGGVSPHGHLFYGNKSTTPSSTYVTLRQIGGTTCGGTDAAPLNRTSYWQPDMLDGQGNVVSPYVINVYYKRHPKTDSSCATNTGNPTVDLQGKRGYCVGIPAGIHFLWGYNMTTMADPPSDVATNYSASWNGFQFTCRTPSDTFLATGYRLTDFSCAVGNDLAIQGELPSCWDGVNLDTANHRSHLVRETWRGGAGDNPQFTGGLSCPVDHPYHIPRISYIIKYVVDSTFPTWQFTSDRQMGKAPGETFHVDYFEAWSPTARQAWLDNCIDRFLECNNGDLGNGFKLKNATIPTRPSVPVKVSDTGVN